MDLDSGDMGKLFSHIKRINGSADEPTTVLNMGGRCIDREEIVEAWANYYRDLASPSDHGFDDNFAAGTEELYSCLCNQPVDKFQHFTEEVVKEAVLSLKLKKTAGPDGIESEHLQFGKETLILLLTLIFNAIMLSGHIPQSLCRGLVIPIPKGLNKDLSNPSNYRALSSFPTSARHWRN